MALLRRSRRSRPDLESAVTDVWREVLDRPVGPGDDFFDLGGNSLHAVQIVGRVEALLEVPVDVGTLFETLTAAGMAARLRTQLERGGASR